MIPKIIHYCWLSNDPFPKQIQKYMSTWKKYLPEYEFMLWNFDRFPKSQSKWVSDAFDNKKYAFAADYIRLYALYHYGGIYLDTDVEVLQSFNKFLNAREMICRETGGDPEVAAFGVEKNCEWIKICLDSYNDKSFVKENGEFDLLPLPMVIKNILNDNGYILKDIPSPNSQIIRKEKEIPILPPEYFSPKSYSTGKINITENTVSIHHFAASWHSICDKIKYKIARMIGPHKMHILGNIKRSFYKLFN